MKKRTFKVWVYASELKGWPHDKTVGLFPEPWKTIGGNTESRVPATLTLTPPKPRRQRR